ncbi:hypothetical protein INS49_011269 [Diaporthe citri]|uniref:uncharacterized protein n=1 Tax=Diaporthe citri TaxID=83186 RepID=UPI001C808D36|nr:uncharacterized protein INS49_011269 [Diaporthe citri]KAG6360213.1 hypothetical protein INS49_011269 [Diaporthe citri]
MSLKKQGRTSARRYKYRCFSRQPALNSCSPAHTTATTFLNHTWTQAPRRRRPSLPVTSRVYPQLLPHHYYHQGQRLQQQRAPTPAEVGTTPAAMGVTGSPSSTQAAPGSTQDGPSTGAANHTASRDPGAPNPSGAAAGHATDLRESAGEHGEAAAGGHEEAEGPPAAAGVEGVVGGGGASGGGGGDPKALPPPTEGGGVRTLEVDGKPISLDHMGPMVVHKDGTLSRISNWGEMTEIERQNTLRILVKRNQVRLGALRQGLQTESDETK